SWATRQLRHNPIKAQRRQIQFINEGIDDADRVILPDVVVQAIRQQDQLAPVLTLNKPLHPAPPEPPRRVPGFTRFYTASGMGRHCYRWKRTAAVGSEADSCSRRRNNRRPGASESACACAWRGPSTLVKQENGSADPAGHFATPRC